MDEYRKAQDGARRTALAAIAAVNKAIRAAYERAWRELRERAQRARDGSLTQRWLDDYAKAVHARAQELSSTVNDTVTGGMRTAAGAAAKATEDWLDLVGLRAGIDRSFTGTLSQASDEAMRAVVTGRAYLDGKRLSQRIWNAAGRLEGGINSVLEQGIAQKKSAYQIAKDLAAFVNPDAWEDYDWHKVYPDLPSWLSKGWTNVEKHAQRVARTSINHAYHIAMKESAARNPFATAIHWELSPSHWERQVKPFGADICDEYAAHDEGLGVGNWPIDGVPLPHPQCLCSQWAVTPDDLDACAQRLRRWLDGGEDASMDAAFAQWRQELQAGENDAIIELTRDDAAQRRAAAMESIAAREDVQGMSTTERQRYFNRLIHASTDELERLALEARQSNSPPLFDAVTDDGLRITKFSNHALFERMIERGITIEAVKDALEHPLHMDPDKTDALGRISRRYIGRNATVNVNPELGVVITVWKTGTKTVRRYQDGIQ